MNSINLMISSTVDELLGERKCIAEVFEKNSLVELFGATPYTKSTVSLSSAQNTLKMAKECDLYILLLGNNFGFELKDGRSATEIEFDAAYHDDPTKILVFLKEDGGHRDLKQEQFVKKVCDYYSGYWRACFQYTHELQSLVLESFKNWLKDRAALGLNLNYLDHFVRLAIQKKPVADSFVYYSVKKDYVEIEYRFFDRILSVHFSKEEVYKDFWGCLYNLERQITL